jgi:hypothetical protein
MSKTTIAARTVKTVDDQLVNSVQLLTVFGAVKVEHVQNRSRLNSWVGTLADRLAQRVKRHEAAIGDCVRFFDGNDASGSFEIEHQGHKLTLQLDLADDFRTSIVYLQMLLALLLAFELSDMELNSSIYMLISSNPTAGQWSNQCDEADTVFADEYNSPCLSLSVEFVADPRRPGWQEALQAVTKHFQRLHVLDSAIVTFASDPPKYAAWLANHEFMTYRGHQLKVGYFFRRNGLSVTMEAGHYLLEQLARVDATDDELLAALAVSQSSVTPVEA